MVKTLPTMQEAWVQSLGQEDPLEKGMATQSSIFVWRIPGTEEPGRVHPWGHEESRHDWATNTFRFCLQCFSTVYDTWSALSSSLRDEWTPQMRKFPVQLVCMEAEILQCYVAWHPHFLSRVWENFPPKIWLTKFSFWIFCLLSAINLVINT